MKYIFSVIFLTIFALVHAQITTFSVAQNSPVTDADLTIEKPQNLRFRLVSAKCKVTASFGDTHNFGSGNDGDVVKAGVKVKLLINGKEILTEPLLISSSKAEVIAVVDIYDEHGTSSEPLEITAEAEFLMDEFLDPNSINPDIQITVEPLIERAVDIRVSETAQGMRIIGNQPEETSARTKKFSWKIQDQFVPLYRFQLLRLYNMDPYLITTDRHIKSDIDWSKALTMDLTGSEVEVTLAQGTGNYVWRVIPVGNYYEGGVTDPRNYGQWSHNYDKKNLESSEDLYDIQESFVNANAYFFFFKDPEENVNYSYQRVITEENKVSESITYANGLQQVLQSQTYLKSNDTEDTDIKTKVVTQAVHDYTGRPSLSSVPVPVDGKITTYQHNVLMADETTPYSAENFDVYNPDPAQNKLENPDPVIQTENTAMKYYNGTESGVPDAEGYPYTRTVYMNDGTGRVQEQSGVGKAHRIHISENAETDVHTTRYIYTKPSEAELVILFGNEALPAEAVIKTITTDPDGTQSISYTTNEGTVLATGLLKDADNAELIVTTFDGNETIIQKELVTENGQEWAYSTKIVAEENVFIQTGVPAQNTDDYPYIEYVFDQKEKQQGCFNFSPGKLCEMVVTIEIFDQEGNLIAKTQEEALTSGSDRTIYQFGRESSNMSTAYPQSDVPFILNNIEPGEYKIVKTLQINADPEDEVSGTFDNRKKTVNALKNIIMEWLGKVTTESDLKKFYISAYNLSNMMNQYVEDVEAYNNDNSQSKDLVVPYGKGADYFPIYSGSEVLELPEGMVVRTNTEQSDFNIDFSVFSYVGFLGSFDADQLKESIYDAAQDDLNDFIPEDYPAYFFIKTGCCSEAKIPIKYEPEFSCPGTGEAFIWEDTKGFTDKLEEDILYIQLEKRLKAGEYEWIYSPDEEENPPVFIGDYNLTTDEKAGILLDEYERIAPGYHPYTMRRMIYHMVNDKYWARSENEMYIDARKLYENDEIDEFASVEDALAKLKQDEYKAQYSCQALWNCWKSTIEMYGVASDVELSGSNGNIRDENNESKGEENDNDEQDGGILDAFDSSFLKFFLKTFYGFDDESVKSEMNQMTPGDNEQTDVTAEYEYHFIDQFLSCSEYKFAQVLTREKPEPIFEYSFNSSNQDVELVYNDNYDATASGSSPVPSLYDPSGFDFDQNILDAWTIADKYYAFYEAEYITLLPDEITEYQHFDWEVSEITFTDLKNAPVNDNEGYNKNIGYNNPGLYTYDDNGDLKKSRFPYIKNPVYAFKYMEYANPYPVLIDQDINAQVYGSHLSNGEYSRSIWCPDNPETNGMEDITDYNYITIVQGQQVNANFLQGNTNRVGHVEVPNCFLDYEAVASSCGNQDAELCYNSCGEYSGYDKWSYVQKALFWDQVKSFLRAGSTAESKDGNQISNSFWVDLAYDGENQPALPTPIPGNLNDIVAIPADIEVPADNPVEVTIENVQKGILFRQNTMETMCQSGCDQRAAEIRAKLIATFLDHCYELEGCNEYNNVITYEEIDLLVGHVLEECRAQCTEVKTEAVDLGYPLFTDAKTCYMLEPDGQLNLSPVTVPFIEYYPQCLEEQLEFPQYWNFQVDLDMESFCDEDNDGIADEKPAPWGVLEANEIIGCDDDGRPIYRVDNEELGLKQLPDYADPSVRAQDVNLEIVNGELQVVDNNDSEN